jgi:hypothetical protein
MPLGIRAEGVLAVDNADKYRDYREHQEDMDEPPYRIDANDAEKPK